MRPSPALLFHPKFLLLLATLFIFSAILSSAAVARSGEQPISFVSQQQGQEQQQQQQQLQPQPPTKQQQQQQQQQTPPQENQHQQDSQPQIPPAGSSKSQAEQQQEEKLGIWRPQSSTNSRPAATLVPATTLIHVPVSSPTSVSTTIHSQAQVSSAPPSPAGSSSSSSTQPSKQQQQTAKPEAKPEAKPLPVPQREYKYFHEAGGTYTLTHYDARYYKGIVPYESHRAVLTHLIRSYLTAFAALGLETWLAHGTLLGWWWNGKTMPWDWDLDVQVSGDTMAELASRFNMTLHDYAYVDDAGKDQTRTYLLDVNPFSLKLDRNGGLNVIDARWIDVETGMFIDITNLLERDPRGRPGVLSCKNFHRYTKSELYPLRESEFEGVAALVPWEFEKILVAEYGAKSLVVTEWEGHRWDPDKQEWIKVTNSGGKKEVL